MPKSTKFSFGAGELDPELYGRTDLEKYDFGAAMLHNFIPRYGGGAFKRRGTVLMEYAASDLGRMFPFEFGENAEDAYLILFQTNSIRIMQDGKYLTHTVKDIESINGQVIHLDGHGYEDGDWVFLDTFVSPLWVESATTNTFRVRLLNSVDNTHPGEATTVQKIVKLSQPFLPEHFFEISFEQVFDQIKFTHPNYPPYVLTRGTTSWTMQKETRGGGKPIPGTPTVLTARTFIQDIIVKEKGDNYNSTSTISLTGGGGSGFIGDLVTQGGEAIGVTIINPGKGYTSTPTVVTGVSGSGATFSVIRPPQNAGFVITVTAVYADGSESGPMRPKVERTYIDFTTVKGEGRYEWPAVENAVSYNVYRSLVYPDGKNIHIGLPLGFIGNTRGTSFTDNNITPDFTRQPHVYYDPFAPGRLNRVVVEDGGSGYTDGSIVTLDGVGTGAVIWPMVDDGAILDFYVADHGEDYLDDTTVSGISPGSGADIELAASFHTRIYPSTSFTFQQRAGYAGTLREPLKIWASQVDNFNNFSKSINVAANDPYEYTINATKQARIKHAMASQAGLLLFTASGIHLLRGPEGQAVTALAAVADPQSFVGVSDVAPVQFGDDILYIQALHRSLRMLEISGDSRRFVGRELSVLAAHFFSGKPIKTFAVSSAAEKLGIGVYTDGSAFGVTIHKEQDVYGFGNIATQGNIKDVVCLTAGVEQDFYFLVERAIAGVSTITVERMNREISTDVEDAIYIDGTISTPRYAPEAQVTLTDKGNGLLYAEANNNVFTTSSVGKVFRAGGGRGIVVQRYSPTKVDIQITRSITARVPETDNYPTFRAGEWFLDPMLETVTGIPYEGATVTVMGDGKTQSPKTVVDGSITLDQPAAVVHVGFSYTAKLKTLPIVAPRENIDGSKVTVVDATMRVLRAGPYLIGDGEDMYDGTYRYGEAWIEANELQQPMTKIIISAGWDDGGSVTITSDVGLPLEITQMVFNYNASDT